MLDIPHPSLSAPAREPADAIVQRRVVDLGAGRTLAYAQIGSGPDLVAIHGTLMTLEDMWTGPAPALAEHFTVTAVDRPGHGRSCRRGHIDASPWRQAELIHEAVGQLGLRRPVLLGHSFGGTVALAYALLYPGETAGVVALAPVCRPEPRLEQVLFGWRALPFGGAAVAHAAHLFSDPVLLPLLWRAVFLPQTMPARFAEAFPFAVAGSKDAMVAEGEDALALPVAVAAMAARYPVFLAPVRFLGGTADLVVNNAAQGRLAAAVMPNASFTWVEGIGHMLHHFAADAVVDAARALVAPAEQPA